MPENYVFAKRQIKRATLSTQSCVYFSRNCVKIRLLFLDLPTNILIIMLVCLFASLPVTYLKGQNSSTSSLEETGLWNGIYLKGKFTNKLGYYGEHHYRLANQPDNINSFVGRTRQIYNRAGLNIYFNNYFEAVIGPTLVLNFSPDPTDANLKRVVYEPRIWHQWLFVSPSMGRFKVYNQFRFEHRWKKTNEMDAEFNFTNRYRYKFFSYIPLNKPNIEVGTVFFSPSAEIFLQSGKSVVFNPLEDFRTYNGFGYVLNQKVTLFAGHMWTFGQKKSGFEYRSSHVIRVNAFIGLDFRKLENKLPEINLGY